MISVQYNSYFGDCNIVGEFKVAFIGFDWIFYFNYIYIYIWLQFVAKKLDRRLSDLGATAIVERGLGDDQHPSGYG